jgi:predicted MFS family arabinose efflux permease
MKQMLQSSGRSSIWRHRDVRLILPARALSSFGDDMALIVLTLRVYDEGFGPWSITALLFCAAFPVVVLAPLAGRLVDSVPFRRLSVLTALWQAACCAALAFGGPVWTTFAFVLLLQAGHVVAGPTWQALIPSVARPDEVGRVVSASQAMNTVAMVAAPAVAGLTVAWLGYSAPLLLDGATFLVLAAAGLAVRASRRVEVQPAESGEPAKAFSLRSDALLWPLIVGLCVFVLAGEVTNVVEVFLLRGTLGASSAAFGLVGAALAAGIVVGSLIAGRTTSDANRALRAAVVATGLAIAILTAGLAPTLVVFAVAWLVLGLMNGVLNVDVSTLLLNRTPEAARGRVLANVNAMARGSTLGAMALGGAAGTLLGPRATFVAAGAVSTVVAGALVVRTRRVLSRDVASGHDPGSPARADRRGARARRRRLVRAERA